MYPSNILFMIMQCSYSITRITRITNTFSIIFCFFYTSNEFTHIIIYVYNCNYFKIFCNI